MLSQNRNLQSENSSMRKQINEINSELNNVQVRENILKNQVHNQVIGKKTVAFSKILNY